MERKKSEKPNWEERTDPDANPLTSFGRDDVFTDELIKGICEKNETVSLASDENTNNSPLQKRTMKLGRNATNKKKQSTRKKRGFR